MKHHAKLPHGFQVTFHWDLTKQDMDVEWDPEPPTKTSFNSARAANKFLEAYQAERDRFIAAIANQIGAKIAVVDLPAKGYSGRFRAVKPVSG